MSPKEKAKELVAHYHHYVGNMIFGRCLPCQSVGMRHCAHADSCGSAEDVRTDKQCALIAVDEIIKVMLPTSAMGVKYWETVKEEINKF